MKHRRSLLPTLVCVACLCACSNYTDRSMLIKTALLETDYDAALKNVEAIDKNRSELLYYYEKGLVLHYQDEFAASNEAFERAEAVLDELYTKSVSREVAALAITDNIAKYRGDAHEAVLVNYYKILNYLHLDDIEGAAVECRRVNGKLQRVRTAEGEYFKDDPFIQYLTGLVYELSRDFTEAEVSYRVAVASFKELGAINRVEAPPSLYCDAADNARQLGDTELSNEYLSQETVACPSPAGEGEWGIVNVFLECGYVAHKIEENIVLPILKDDDISDNDKYATTLVQRRGMHYEKKKVDYWLKVAMPALINEPESVFGAELSALGGEGRAVASGKATLVEDVSALARMAFDDKAGKILLRSVVRALGKYAAKKKADQNDKGLGVLVNIFGALTESADTRSWSTLPDKVLMCRLQAPAGNYDLEVKLFNNLGQLHDTFTIPGVEVVSGTPRFINYRVH